MPSRRPRPAGRMYSRSATPTQPIYKRLTAVNTVRSSGPAECSADSRRCRALTWECQKSTLDRPPNLLVRSRHVPSDHLCDGTGLAMRPSRLRVIVVAAIVVAATSVSAVVVPRQGHGAWMRAGAEAGEEHEATRTIRGATCGVERWPVKTLSDPAARLMKFAVHPATVRYLGSLRASSGGQDSRSPLESRVFAVRARLVGVKREADSDYHLILSEGGATMIAEMPFVGCTAGAQDRRAMTTARAGLERAVGGPVGESWV